MPNDRIDQVEQKLQAKSDARDAEIRELAEAYAVIESESRALASQHAALTAAVEKLASAKPPGLIAIAGPTIAGLVVVASLGVFVLDQRVAPLEKSQAVITAQLVLFAERQFTMRSTTEYQRGRQDMLEELVRSRDAEP